METQNMEQIFQQVAEILVKIIPEDWKKIFLYAEVREGYKKVFFYYYPKTKKERVYSLDIKDLFIVDENQFDRFEDELYYCFTKLLEEFMEQKEALWTNLTFILNDSGDLKLNYSYEDVSEYSPVEKQAKWEEEYLI